MVCHKLVHVVAVQHVAIHCSAVHEASSAMPGMLLRGKAWLSELLAAWQVPSGTAAGAEGDAAMHAGQQCCMTALLAVLTGIRQNVAVPRSSCCCW